MKRPAYIFCVLTLVFSVLWGNYSAAQRTVEDKEFHYKLTFPDSLLEKASYQDEGDKPYMYYDATKGVVLIISGRKSLFTDIKSYLDCSRENLERDLQLMQGDTTLRLVECRRSTFYPDKSVVLHFETSVYDDFDRCMVYFFHHKGCELQFFFLYNNKTAKSSLDYISGVMQSLKLK